MHFTKYILHLNRGGKYFRITSLPAIPESLAGLIIASRVTRYPSHFF